MKRLVLPTFAATLLTSGLAYAGGSATAAADTFVRRDNSGPYGSAAQIVVKNAGDHPNTRAGLIRFEGVAATDAMEATLSLDVSMFNGGDNATFHVWGVRQDMFFFVGFVRCAELFDESTILYNDPYLAYLDTSEDGAENDHLCLSGGEPLGSFTVNESDLGSTVTFKSSALATFMREEDFNNTVTLLITRSSGDGGSMNTSFASKEHSTLQPPRLSWTSMGDYAEFATATDDTYVRRNNGGPYGSEAHIYVKNVGDDKNTRKGFIRFDNVDTSNALDSTLALDVSMFNGGDNATFYVWGIMPNMNFFGLWIECGELFNESTLRYNDSVLEYLDDSSDGVDNNFPAAMCFYNGQKLGSFTIHEDDLGNTIYFKSEALDRFLSGDKNGNATFLITRANKGSMNTGFASKEHPTLQPPRLFWTSGNGVDLPDWELGAVENSDGSFDYVGELRIPVAGGDHITIPGANLTMTFSPTGKIETISGTVGFMELPGAGLLGALGDISTSGPALSIGYDYAYNFNTVGLPLDDYTRYFYFLMQSGASIEWGPMSLATPNTGSTLLALDANAPAFMVFTDQFLPESPITSVAVGVSGADTIPFDPWHDEGVEPYMTSFNGDLYLGGSIEIPTKIPGVSVEVAGDMTLNANDDNFAAGHPEDWIEDLGANADLSVIFGIGWLSFTGDVGGATLLYQRHGEGNQPSVAYSGEVNPSFLNDLPIGFKGQAHTGVYLSADNSGMDSYMEVEGELDFGSIPVDIDASVFISPSEVTLSGKADFAGMKMDVAGSIDQGGAEFSGSIEKNFNAYVGKVEAKIKASFDTNPLEVSLSASAKFCVDNPWPATGQSCDSIGIDEVTLKSDGHVKICVDIPAYGDACQTF